MNKKVKEAYIVRTSFRDCCIFSGGKRVYVPSQSGASIIAMPGRKEGMEFGSTVGVIIRHIILRNAFFAPGSRKWEWFLRPISLTLAPPILLYV